MSIHFFILFLVCSLIMLANNYSNLYLFENTLASNQDINISENNELSLKNKVFFYATFIIMTLFLGLRDMTIGTDTVTYVSQFLRNDYSFSGFEVLLPLISRIVGIFTSKYFIYLILVQAVILLGIFYNLRRYNFSKSLFLFLYITSFCYIYSTSAVRFFCALSIIMISFKFMIEKNDKKVIISVLIAALFHNSALFFIPVYYFTKFELKPYFIIFTFIIATIIILLTKIIDIDFILRIGFLNKYTYIADKQNTSGGISVLINIFILVFIIMYRPIVKIYRKDFDFFIKIHFISIFLDFFSYGYRLLWYFRFPVWFIIPIAILNLKHNKYRKSECLIIYPIIIIAYLLYYYILLKSSLHSHNFLNYTFNTGLK